MSVAYVLISCKTCTEELIANKFEQMNTIKEVTQIMGSMTA